MKSRVQKFGIQIREEALKAPVKGQSKDREQYRPTTDALLAGIGENPTQKQEPKKEQLHMLAKI